MKTRREFLASATTTLLLIPIVACSSSSSPSSSPSSPSSPGSPFDGGACDGVESTSSLVSQHTHLLCVPTSDLESPPAGGATYTSSVAPDPLATGAPDSGAHTHTVTLSQAQLSSVQAGQSVTTTSSISLEHDHTFLIVRAGDASAS